MSINIQNVKKYIGEKKLIDIPQLIISKGSRIGVVGSNGSGKTTLLKMIHGTEDYDQGEIRIDGDSTIIEQLLEAKEKQSGGEQTKEKIRKSMMDRASVLLADEPSNHLDESGRKYLMKQLKRYSGTIVMVSHDRALLNECCHQILEISDGRVTLYEGNYDAYLEQKEREKVEQEKKYLQYVNEKNHLLEAIDGLQAKSAGIKKAPKRMGNSEARLHKRGKGQTAKKALSAQANALQTRVEKLGEIASPKKENKLVIPFSKGKMIHRKDLISSEKLMLQIGDKQLIEDGIFKVMTGHKTAIVGNNGVGKTTLLQAIIDGHEGLDIAKTATFSYFSQTFDLLEESKTIFENVQSTSLYEPQDTMDLLAHLLFRGEESKKEVKVLSGGERTKVAIAKMILNKSNVLVLDEPTNHLDLVSLHALEEALIAYKGSVVFVSHDDYFVKKVADDILEIKNMKVTNLNEQSKQIDSEEEERWLLEMRKTTLLSELSMPLEASEKEKREKDFQDVIKKINIFKQQEE